MTDKGKTTKNWIKPAVLAVVLLGAGGLGVAAAKSDGWGAGYCGQRHGGFGPGKAGFEPGRYIDGKLAFLKTELKITDEQEQAWQEFAAVVRETSEERAAMRETFGKRRADAGDAALDERIDRHLEAMEQRVAMLRGVADAAKTLYGELTPAQQAIADDMLPRRHGHGRRFGFH